MIIYQNEFDETLKERKMVVSCYSDYKLNLERISTDSYDPAYFNAMDTALYYECQKMANQM